MRYIWQHISAIIETYNGGLSLAHFLKNYFNQFPKLGSRDRKMLSAMAYSWYRSSKGIKNKEWFQNLVNEWISDHSKFRNFSMAHWLEDNKATVSFDVNALFPYDIDFSPGIDRDQWLASMLTQPDLFIRVRKNKQKAITLLGEHQIPYTAISESCIALPNGAKMESILPSDCYLVQDASSQQTGTYFNPKKNEQWYDCCSGAGGKSLLLKDIEPGVKLTVSDLRGSIIHNLQQRFKQYGHTLPTAYVTDVANKEQLDNALAGQQFNNIICDAPCSGSGTWARTPEQLYFFDPASLEKFAALQKIIAINVFDHLKPGGRLFYITCSVFRNENEDVVNDIIKQTGLTLELSHIISGISIKADSMYIAVLKRVH